MTKQILILVDIFDVLYDQTSHFNITTLVRLYVVQGFLDAAEVIITMNSFLSSKRRKNK